MKNFKFKKVMALSLCSAMIAGTSITAFAETDPAASSVTGTSANILAHNVETVVVPTSLKIAINPDGKKAGRLWNSMIMMWRSSRR